MINSFSVFSTAFRQNSSINRLDAHLLHRRRNQRFVDDFMVFPGRRHAIPAKIHQSGGKRFYQLVS